MSEVLHPIIYSLDDHQALVLATRHENHPTDWKDGYYNFVHSEFGEFASQHGPAMTLLLHGVNRAEILSENPELLDGIKEEIGDLLWFDFSAAALMNTDAKTLSSDALKVHTGKRYQLDTFADLEEAVCSNAHKIEALTKWGIYHPELPHAQKYASLLGAPYYLFNRTTFRVTRALSKDKFDAAPLTASQMEPVSDLGLAIGDHINTLTYIAHLVGLSVEDIARANIDKLQQRAIYGKSEN